MAATTVDQPVIGLAHELWWLGVIEAIVAILFGIISVFWPGLTLITLVYLLGFFVIIYGVAELIRGLMQIGRGDTWWITVLLGLVTFGVGIYLARHPSVSFHAFILIVGITFIVWGVMDLSRSFLEIGPGSHRVLNFIAGLAAVLVGIYTLFQPVSGGLAFVWAWGLYGIIYGVTLLAAAMRLHREFRELGV